MTCGHAMCNRPTVFTPQTCKHAHTRHAILSRADNLRVQADLPVRARREEPRLRRVEGHRHGPEMVGDPVRLSKQALEQWTSQSTALVQG